jgi:hypothetical protein
MRLRRIWSETVPYGTLRAPAVTKLLRRFELGIVVAVRPSSISALDETVRALEGEGVAVALWPMLDDADGRWANTRNIEAFVSFAREVAAAARRPGEMFVDLEPPIDEVRAAMTSVRGARRFLDGHDEGLTRARDALGALLRDLDGDGFAASAAVVPMVLQKGWEAILGTPVTALPWKRINVMLYTSILEGWSRGLLARDDAVSLLVVASRAARAQYGDRAAVSLGAVGTGAFGDEPVYRDPSELARDVLAARACGVDDLTLFELGGVLARAPAEDWLEPFVANAPVEHAPAPTFRSRAALSVVGAASYLAPLLRQLRP